jgi:hypothetical protein
MGKERGECRLTSISVQQGGFDEDHIVRELRFNKAETAQAPTTGRILDHIGFDVKDLKAFIKTLEASNIKLDRPYTVNDIGVGIAFITDPWGTYIEINERPPQ